MIKTLVGLDLSSRSTGIAFGQLNVQEQSFSLLGSAAVGIPKEVSLTWTSAYMLHDLVVGKILDMQKQYGLQNIDLLVMEDIYFSAFSSYPMVLSHGSLRMYWRETKQKFCMVKPTQLKCFLSLARSKKTRKVMDFKFNTDDEADACGLSMIGSNIYNSGNYMFPEKWKKIKNNLKIIGD